MIVDDHAGSRKMIRMMLDGPSMTFCECSSGDEAVERARDFQPDWVTMDLHMPGLSGLKATAHLKNQNPQSRIIIVTGDNQPYFRGMAHMAGATAFLCKENLIELRSMVASSHNTPSSQELSPEI